MRALRRGGIFGTIPCRGERRRGGPAPPRLFRDGAGVLLAAALLLGQLLGGAARASPYPLDGYERTGIRRLRVYDLVERGELAGTRLASGALLPVEAIRLRLVEHRGLDVETTTPKDAALQRGLEAIFAGRDENYAIALLDITDPTAVRYAAINEDRTYLPGSVGKILVMTGVFGALATAFPDPAERLEVLRDTWIVADRFAMPNSHTVPIVDLAVPALEHRAIRIGDRFSLFEWIDHMVSPSSNAAGSVSWKQAMLLSRFGSRYPPSAEDEASFFGDTQRAELQRIAVAVIEEPLVAAGLDADALMQGTMFTRGAEAVVPGVRSLASPRQLVRWLVRLEQGRLVDRWSSLEMKRLLYYTKRRYRYAISPALRDAAVYFKSGSFYQCAPEENFRCGQYRGNVNNLMNSVAIVEQPARPQPGEAQRVYLVALMSNVLRRNSAEDHRDIATEIDGLLAADAGRAP